jgi:hypothetical protein
MVPGSPLLYRGGSVLSGSLKTVMSRGVIHDGGVRTEAGVALVVAGSALGLAMAFGLRTRVPVAAVALALGVAGVAAGAGALLLQDDPSPADWAVTLVSLGVLVPFHVRVMLGPLGRRGSLAPREPRPGGGPDERELGEDG